MKRVASSVLGLVGNTPLVELTRLTEGAGAVVWAKLESFNPAGSSKDRVAIQMIEDAQQSGIISEGATIIEPTSGNTGVGLALVSAINGYRLILTMPETMSIERRRLVAAYGAEVVLTPAEEGIQGAIDKAEELQRSIEGSIILQQFSNPSNPLSHYHTTAEEIWRDTEGEVDILIASVGTGGTLCGTARRLKEYKESLEVVAVEPASSPVLSGGKAGAHKIQGIGTGFVPANYDASLVDRVICIEDQVALQTARELARREGLLVGISSGAVVAAAQKVACEPQNRGKKIVVILPDTGERYLSTELFSE